VLLRNEVPNRISVEAPQMYSGLVVLYACLPKLLLFLNCDHRRLTAPFLLLVTSLALAAATRFRIHIALAVLPAFLLVNVYWWQEKR
jgi:hypothetical protein